MPDARVEVKGVSNKFALTYTSVSVQGGRLEQEDQLVIVQAETATVLAVFDGHGGIFTSSFAAKTLPALWNSVVNMPPEQHLQAVVRNLAEATAGTHLGGSTLSIAVIPNGSNTVYCAALGDSPIMAFTEQGWQDGPDHNARSNEKERQAAEQRGAVFVNGYLWGSHGGLQMARALGDASLPFVSHKPEFCTWPNVQILLVGTDGIFGGSHESEDADRATVRALLLQGATARDLVNTALNQFHSKDNISAIVARLAMA